MTESFDFSTSPDQVPVAPPEPSATQAGLALRQAREAKGVHLVALASALKVPTKHLENLEAGAFEALPDLVFAKALAASVCRHMGVDPAQVLQWWPQVNNPTLSRASAAGPIKPTTFDPYPDRPKPWRWLFLVLGFLGVVSGLAWLWWMPTPLEDTAEVAPTEQIVAASGAGTDATSPTAQAPASAVISATADAQSSADPTPGSAGTENPKPVLNSAPAEPTPSAAVAPAKPQPEAGASTAAPEVPTVAPTAPSGDAAQRESGLAIEVLADAWIDVRNARDGVLVSRVVPKGETLQWPLAGGPWRLVVGNAQGVKVLVQGQVRDLTPDTRANVARFSLE